MRYILLIVIVFFAGYYFGALQPLQQKGVMNYIAQWFQSEDKAKPAARTQAPDSSVQKVSTDGTQEKQTPVVNYNKKAQEAGEHIYAIQIGAFKSKEKAQRFVEQLVAEKMNAYIAPVDLQKDEGYYRIMVGESIDLTQARNNLNKLRGRFTDSFIVAF